MADISRQKVDDLLKGAPSGTTKLDLIKSLEARGHKVEQFSMNPSERMKVNPDAQKLYNTQNIPKTGGANIAMPSPSSASDRKIPMPPVGLPGLSQDSVTPDVASKLREDVKNIPILGKAVENTVSGIETSLGKGIKGAEQMGEVAGEVLFPGSYPTDDKISKFGGGVADVIGGAIGTVFSPVAGAVSAIPVAGDLAGEAYDFYKRKVAGREEDSLANGWLNLWGIDRNSEQGQNTFKLFDTLADLIPLKAGESMRPGTPKGEYPTTGGRFDASKIQDQGALNKMAGATTSAIGSYIKKDAESAPLTESIIKIKEEPTQAPAPKGIDTVRIDELNGKAQESISRIVDAPTGKKGQKVQNVLKFQEDMLAGAKNILKEKKIVSEILKKDTPESVMDVYEASKATRDMTDGRTKAILTTADAAGATFDASPVVEFIKQEFIETSRASEYKSAAAKLAKEIKNLDGKSLSELKQWMEDQNSLTREAQQSKTFTTTPAVVKTPVLQRVRAGIEKSIEDTTGQGKEYTKLNQEYGVNSEFHTAFNRAASRMLKEEFKKNPTVYKILTNISAGADVLSVFTGGGGSLLKAAGIKGGELLYNYLSSPNRAVQKMFESLEELSRLESIDAPNPTL